MNRKNLTISIVDDEEDIRRSIALLLQARMDGVAVQTFETGELLLEAVHPDLSGVVILDQDFTNRGKFPSRMKGLDVFKELKQRKSPLVVVFLSQDNDIRTAVGAMKDGADTWLPKPCSDDELLTTVQAAREKAVDRAVKGKRLKELLSRWETLTTREKEVTPYLAAGNAAKVVARRLTENDPARPIDSRTVETHWGKIKQKLDVASSNELQSLMREAGLMEGQTIA